MCFCQCVPFKCVCVSLTREEHRTIAELPCGLIMQMHCAGMQSCNLKFREPMAFHTHGALAALETTSDQSFTVTPPIADRKKRFAESMSPAALEGDTTW